MRRENGNAPILHGVEAINAAHISCLAYYIIKRNPSPFNEHKFFGSHASEVFPLVILVVCHTEDLAFVVGIYECNWENVLLGVNAPVVTQSERPIERGIFDGTPEVNQLEAFLQELRDVGGGKMTMHARNGRWGSFGRHALA